MRLLFLLLFTTTMVNAQGLLEDFEDNRFVNYSFVSGVLNDAVTNPDMSGSNTSSKCAEYIRNPSEQYDLLQIRPYDTFDNVADYVSGNKVITIDVWSSMDTMIGFILYFLEAFNLQIMIRHLQFYRLQQFI